MYKYRHYLFIFIAVIFNFTACSKTYKIGENCPAGGIVFYDKGFEQDGWRYLSVAPAEYEFNAQWSYRYDYIEGTSTDIGTGKQNTQLIVDFSNQNGENDSAAQLCLNLKVGNYSDWFLPSKDELNEMYKLKDTIGGFQDSWYWSSSQNDDDYICAWNQFFKNGAQPSYFKEDTGRVRAVRAF